MGNLIAFAGADRNARVQNQWDVRNPLQAEAALRHIAKNNAAVFTFVAREMGYVETPENYKAPTFGLTRKQRECLDFIRAYRQENHGVTPSYQEIMEALDLRSKSGVARLTAALKERGFIDFIPNAKRNIVLLEEFTTPSDRGTAQ